jgi:Family of unknown function (DUF5343)
MAKLPYLTSPGSLKTGLERIREAATPDRVTGDFVATKLQLKGGTGFAFLPYLKKIGFVASDGSPTDLYKRFRNSATAGAAVADATKIGYKELLQVNEYFYELDDKKLLDLIIQVTGAEAKSSLAKQTLATIKTLKSFADFKAPKPAETPVNSKQVSPHVVGIDHALGKGRLGLNLSYTINLNLPATTDQAVFNAIFRSLKEHLLTDDE